MRGADIRDDAYGLGQCWSARPVRAVSVAAGDPFLQVGAFGADGGVRSVTGVDDRVRIEDEQPVTDRVDDRAEVGEGTPGRARATGEQRVPAEQPALIGQAEADGAA